MPAICNDITGPEDRARLRHADAALGVERQPARPHGHVPLAEHHDAVVLIAANLAPGHVDHAARIHGSADDERRPARHHWHAARVESVGAISFERGARDQDRRPVHARQAVTVVGDQVAPAHAREAVDPLREDAVVTICPVITIMPDR